MEETMAGCQRLAFKDIHNFIMSLVGEDLHAKRVYSLANATQGIITSASQIINMKHELVALAGKIDWAWIDGEIAPLYSDQGRPGVETRFVIGLLLLKHIYGLSDEGVCERAARQGAAG